MQVDWSKAPEWANWHAFDNNGCGYWYEIEPVIIGHLSVWNNGKGGLFKLSDRYIGYYEDWKQSLTRRPAQVERTDTTQQILSERGSRYGKFSDLSSIDQALRSVMRQAPNWGSLKPHHKTALEMIQHKVSRILNGDPEYEDNWIDIEGYSRLGREPEQ